MKIKINICSIILACCCAMSVSAMEVENQNVEVQQAPVIQRQRLYFNPNTGYKSETIFGTTYAHYPIALSNGQTARITFLTKIDQTAMPNDEQANDYLQPKYDRHVANLSCANVDDEAITNWYVQMFGLSGSDETDKNVHISLVTMFDRVFHLEAKPIIFDQSLNDEQRYMFINAFKKIASIPVGRVLLYRILIELTRCYGDGDNIKWADSHMAVRDNCRLINLVFQHGNVSMYNSEDEYRTLNININDYSSYCSVGLNGVYKLSDQGLDIGLFKKLNSWYHILLDSQYTCALFNSHVSSFTGQNLVDPLLKYCATIGNDLNAWWYSSVEDIRSILGEMTHDYGLGISENAYRFSRDFEEYIASNRTKVAVCQIHWGNFYDSKIRPNIAGVKLAIQNAAQCVGEITGINVLPYLRE